MSHSQKWSTALEKGIGFPESKGRATVFEECPLLYLKMGSPASDTWDAEKAHRQPGHQRLSTILSDSESLTSLEQHLPQPRC